MAWGMTRGECGSESLARRQSQAQGLASQTPSLDAALGCRPWMSPWDAALGCCPGMPPWDAALGCVFAAFLCQCVSGPPSFL